MERVLGGVVVEAVGNQYQGFAKELLQGFLFGCVLLLPITVVGDLGR